ncbi:hypothetical protein Q9K02_06525 [Qipengyuania sp. G39]|uniref:Nuclear transport factor 2 family protein n=1 Tax=Qipengyuania profundimaris TaxID=3067652 RepID=A0ABT9HNQ3_9SPHN|nr:hypothetical protein [Qipengyuania sp. G39]MDP4574794.1 hypothetical protein [Qipengyuania sp. G39]
MRLIAVVFATVSMSLVSVATSAQEASPPGIEYGGSHPPDPEAIAVALEYAAADSGYSSVEERDERRSRLVSPAYFYHGLDGHPVSFDGLTERQTANGLEDASVNETFGVVFHQYENTALVTYKTWNVRMDMGRERALLGSGLMVLSRTEDGWKVVSDFLGREPSDDHVPSEILEMRDAYLAEQEETESLSTE